MWYIVTFQEKVNFIASSSLICKFLMAPTVRNKLGRIISVWMERVHNTLKSMRSKINIKNNKDRNKMNIMIAKIYQKKKHLLWTSMLTFKKVLCWV